MKLQFGERIGKHGTLALSCCGIAFDSTRTKVLLVRRADNRRWCLPGGFMQAGESVSEACTREVWEETHLPAQVTRLIGVYSNPHILAEYADGRRCHVVVLVFEVTLGEGETTPDAETVQFGYFSLAEVEALEMDAFHQEQVRDAFKNDTTTILK